MDNEFNEESTQPRIRSLWLLAVGLVAVIAAVSFAWWNWRSSKTNPATTSLEGVDLRVLELENQMRRMRELQRSQSRSLDDNASRTRLLRDESLAISQRANLLEENVQQLTQQTQEGRTGTQLDQLELLLSMAKTRWDAAADLSGALQATEQAALSSSRLQDIRYLSVRQSILQEQAELRGLKQDPVRDGVRILDQLSSNLPKLESAAADYKSANSGWERLLASLIDVRDAGDQRVYDPAGKQLGESALAQEIATARMSVYLRDQKALQNACERIDRWLVQLYADGPALRKQRADIQALGKASLQINAPLFGSSLDLLRSLRNGNEKP
jgi:uncharacterized protein HemX